MTRYCLGMFDLQIIGCGKMGRAILEGVLATGAVSESRVSVIEPDLGIRKALRDDWPNLALLDNPAESEITVIATKPNLVKEVCFELAKASGGLVISIAAGITLEAIETSVLASSLRVVRAMPNTPGQIGKGITAISCGSNVLEQDLSTASSLLAALGEVVEVPEYQLDAVTALSGSGPAYLFIYFEAMVDSGIELGLSRDLSARLVAATILGSTQLLKENAFDTLAMRLAVSSPGGTTIAATNELERFGFRHAINQAVKAAFQRSKSIG